MGTALSVLVALVLISAVWPTLGAWLLIWAMIVALLGSIAAFMLGAVSVRNVLLGLFFARAIHKKRRKIAPSKKI